MKKIQLFLIMLLVGIQAASAQSVQVNGKVTYADDGTPVIGATINVKGSTVATVTDVNGDYKITIPANQQKVLVFKSLGLLAQEIAVTTPGTYNVSMKTDALQADDVVVTAYGATSKKAFTGTAAVVSSKEMKNLQISSPANALQGLATGVMAVNTIGQPGESATIRVRGVGSLSNVAGASDPLIILDGVTYNGNLSSISSQDIESMTVLKDANSTALYGSRAANGVIMITTKSGAKGKTRITANASYGMSQRATKGYAKLGAKDYLELQWQSLYNSQFYNKGVEDQLAREYATNRVIPTVVYNPYGMQTQTPIGLDGKTIDGISLLYDQDWYKALTQVATRQQYDIAVSGGNDNAQYMFTLGMISEDGIMKGSKFERYNARVKVDTKITNWLRGGLNSSISYSMQNFPTQASGYARNPILVSNWLPNIYPVNLRNQEGEIQYDEQGNAMLDFGNGVHPGTATGIRPGQIKGNLLGSIEKDIQDRNRFLSTNNAFLEASFLKHFKLRSTLGVEYYQLMYEDYYNPLFGDGSSYGGLSNREFVTNTTISWVNTLTYDQTFNDKHHVNVLVGMDSYDYAYKYSGSTRYGFPYLGVYEQAYATGTQEATSNRTSTRNMRYLARGTYDFDDRYHISASFSYDGTSRFAQGKRWGAFYSVGGAWNISNESFFADHVAPEIMNNLKLRASYGTSGNSNIGYYPYLATYEAGYNILDNGGAIISTMANPNLTWEKQGQLDVGMDFGFLNGYLNLGVTYYNRRSDALLMQKPIAPSSGFNGFNDNVGAMLNHGVEIELNATIFNRKDITWTAGFNISFLENKVLSLPSGPINSPISSGKRLEVGKSAYSWYLREFAGVDVNDGKPMWYVINNDGTKSTTKTYANASLQIVGDALPKWQGGVNTNFQWKGLDVGIVASFSIGGKILDTDYAQLMHGFRSNSVGMQSVEEAKNAWQKPGDITNVPMLNTTNFSFNSASTRWLVDASYLRLRNLTIGYNFASISGVKRAGFSNLRLYCSADNLFTIFNKRGLDPEQGIDAQTNLQTGAMRTISFGLNIGF